MKNNKLTAKALNNAMRKAREESLRLDKALGLPHLEVHDGYLVRIEPNGNQTRLRKAVFGIRKKRLEPIAYSQLHNSQRTESHQPTSTTILLFHYTITPIKRITEYSNNPKPAYREQS